MTTNLSGLEMLQRLLRGELPPPPFAEVTDIRPVLVERGHIVFEGTPSARFNNPLGSVHGGWIAALLDSGMGCAVHSELAAGQAYTTIEMKVSFIRAVTEATGVLTCDCKTIHVGGRIGVAEGRVLDPSGRLIAHGTETCAIFEARG